MPIVIIGRSAIEYWCSEQVHKIMQQKNAGKYLDLPLDYYDDFSINPLDVIVIGRRFNLSFPIHLACPKNNFKRNNKNYILHYCPGAFPEESFQPINFVGIPCYIARPELCFLQAAQTIDKVGLILLGYDLCARYSIGKGNNEGFQYKKNLTSLKHLKSFIKNAKGVRGKKAARAALKHVTDNSFSPQESRLSIMFSLPLEDGGYGIGKPHLNYPVKLDALSKRVLGLSNSTIHADFLWPRSRKIIEYNSNTFHLEKAAYTQDANRQAIYKHANYHSHILTTGHLKNVDALDSFIMLVWNNIIIEELAKNKNKREELFNKLFHS